MTSREASLRSPVWHGRENDIRPISNPKASDSSNLDSAAEVRVTWPPNFCFPVVVHFWRNKEEAEIGLLLVTLKQKGNSDILLTSNISLTVDKKKLVMTWFIPARVQCIYTSVVVQLLIRSGRTPEESLMILVPEAYKNHPTLMIKYPEVLLRVYFFDYLDTCKSFSNQLFNCRL